MLGIDRTAAPDLDKRHLVLARSDAEVTASPPVFISRAESCPIALELAAKPSAAHQNIGNGAFTIALRNGLGSGTGENMCLSSLSRHQAPREALKRIDEGRRVVSLVNGQVTRDEVGCRHCAKRITRSVGKLEWRQGGGMW